MGLNARKPVFTGFASNKRADLIRAFILHLLDSILSKIATGEISIF